MFGIIGNDVLEQNKWSIEHTRSYKLNHSDGCKHGKVDQKIAMVYEIHHFWSKA